MQMGLTAVADVDWSRLFHAYGMASDTPGHLRALVGDDEDARRAAVLHLGGAVIHQGTPWTVTPPAALVVAGLLADPRTARPVADPFSGRDSGGESAVKPLRVILLGFLREVAEAARPGVPEDELRAAAYPAGREPDIPALARRMFAVDGWGDEDADAEDEDEEDADEEDADEDEEEWDEEVADAAVARATLDLRAMLPGLAAPVAACLGDDDPRVRDGAAEALAAIEAVTAG
ncbi:hypothetical protein ACFFMN_34290 [Planobispora siamensis]|uniref:HEAT repeat-containing protein n=1 Tax=Planobispora siamensis TaxID=936338 RepID=A0A8J3SF23_9ACTN|nr:hypothetical protein [Planobispora siamensis]GIH91875.1 hypothetical protein Psi01_25050 [Planobispora siamensis]